MTVLSVSGISKNFGSVVALDDVSFDIKKNEITGFLGPNGAGKSTTIGIIMQYIFPDRGDVQIFGESASLSIAQLKSRIGLIPATDLPTLKGIKLLKHTGRLYGLRGQKLQESIEEVINVVGGKSFLARSTKTYSTGQKQRLKIANALVHNPELIIADEPTAGLDPISRRTLLNLFSKLRAEGKAIFFSNHIISEVENIADKVILLNRGKVTLQGNLQEILSTLPVANSFQLRVDGYTVENYLSLPGIISAEPQSNGRMKVLTDGEYGENPEFLGELIRENQAIQYFAKDYIQLEELMEREV